MASDHDYYYEFNWISKMIIRIRKDSMSLSTLFPVEVYMNYVGNDEECQR
jgi:hypothetical protein